MTHPEFFEVLSRRIAEYSGRDATEVRSAVAYTGARRPVRVADLVLHELRAHVEDEDEPSMVAAYQDARRRLIARLGDELGTGNGAGTEVQQQQQARAEAERVFARVVEVIDPVALSCGEPRAVAQQRSSRIAAGLAALHALPAGDRVPDAETVGDWVDAGQHLDSVDGDSLARSANRQRLVSRVDLHLRRAASDGMNDLRTGTREPDLMFRNGIAVAWSAKAQRELGANTGVEALAASDGSLPDRFEGRMADGFAGTIAEFTGRSKAEVLDALCAAGGPVMGRRDQWDEARRLMVPYSSLEAVEDVTPGSARASIINAMRDELKRQYGDAERTPLLSPEDVGTRMAAAGAEVAHDLGIGPVQVIPESDPESDAEYDAVYDAGADTHHDPGLDAAFNAAAVPPRGAQGQTSGVLDESSDFTAGQGAAQRPGIRGSRTSATHQPHQL